MEWLVSLSETRVNRYVNEFAGRHNQRDDRTLQRMAEITRGMVGRRLRWGDLTGK